MGIMENIFQVTEK